VQTSDENGISNPRENTPEEDIFAEDDYEAINSAYFDEIFKARSWGALPAGWHNPYCEAASLFEPATPDEYSLQHYTLDEGYALEEPKHAILELISTWEGRGVNYNELTLCPSVSTANLSVLSALKIEGIESIIFETPMYFGTRQQAELLGLKIIRIPCFRDNRFDNSVATFHRGILEQRRCALWLTQPRFGIGTNQSIDFVCELARLLGPHNVLVIDEAAEQMFPSTLSGLGPVECTIIRTRGLLKGIGLNGLRTAFVLHPRSWRAKITEVLEAVGASLDRYSLTNAAALAKRPGLFHSMLIHANTQVQRERKNLEVMSLGSWMEPTALENSYIGSLLLDLTVLPGEYAEKRKALLSYCRDRRMPVILSASIGFAFDERLEAVRINYFTSSENLRSAARILLDAEQVLRQDLLGR
jgi:aspartate/methionine/tyrosine aminotransferase